MTTRSRLFGLYTIGLMVAAASTLWDLFVASAADNTASHVLMVPVVSAGLIVLHRQSIFETTSRAPAAGVPVVLAGLLLLILGRTQVMHPDALSLAVAGVVVAWAGGFLAFYGPVAARAALFPLLFLGFTIPFPASVVELMTELLKSGSAEMVDGLFTLTGTTFHREGFVFTLPSFAIEIADECSGIRSSIALLLTGLLAGDSLLRKAWAKAVVVAVVLPLAIVKNAVRIVGLSLLAVHVDPSFLTGQLHHEGGVVFFLLALAMLAPVVGILRKVETVGVGPARPSTQP